MRVYKVKRRRDQSESDETPATDRDRHSPKRVKRANTFKKPRLTQMTIDLGGEKVKKCPECEMEYVISSKEDVKMHRQYHSLNSAIFDIPPRLLQDAMVIAEHEESRHLQLKHTARDKVIKITRSNTASLRRIASRVLEVVEKELGAIRTTNAELWSRLMSINDQSKVALKACPSNVTETTFSTGDSPLYTMYLYLRNRRCVGLCLVKDIRSGRMVLPLGPGTDSTLVEPSYKLFPARLGISRIWVSQLYRREGIAQCLLDAARNTAMNGIPVLQHELAFSQPTVAGLALARRWFGRDHGWLVFDDETCMIQENQRGSSNEANKAPSPVWRSAVKVV